MFVPSITDVNHRLPVSWRVVRVPLQQQLLLAGRLRRIHTVRPLTGICYLRQGPGLICLTGHFQVFVKTPVTVLELLPGSGTLKAAGKYFSFLFF